MQGTTGAYDAPSVASITVHVHDRLEFRYLSFVFAGLALAARQRSFRLRFNRVSGESPQRTSLQRCLLADIEWHGADSCAVCFDLMDSPEVWETAALEKTAHYFKRSLISPPPVSVEPGKPTAQIQAFGLTYPVRPDGIVLSVLREMRAAYRNSPRTVTGDPERLLSAVWMLWRLRTLAQLRYAPMSPKDPVILYQPRLWDPRGMTDVDAEALNARRVETLLLLQKSFPRHFVGGLVPDRYSRRHYPDLVVDVPHDPHSYSAQIRRASIGVYTVGLHGSPANKLAEYLLASCAVVAEPIGITLPTPLNEQNGLLEAKTAEQCAEHCERLLSNPAYLRDVRFAAARYAEREVVPDSAIDRVLAAVRAT